MKIIVDKRAQKEINKLNKQEKSKVGEYISLFTEYGFGLTEKYLKKVDRLLWELRPGSVRLFFIKINPNTIIIHAMRKKSQRITKATKEILKQRTKEWINEIK